jgi:hypothetical protein
MSSSMRLAMMAAAGSRGRDGIGRRAFAARTAARLAGFPPIISSTWKAALACRQAADRGKLETVL